MKDQVTKDMVTRGYEILSDTGRVIRRVPPGKTIAEEEEVRLQELEKKKEAIALQQRIRDDAELLRQFSSISDIIRNRDAQLLGLEQRIRIQKSKEDLLKLQLQDLQRQAATHERLGQNIPKGLHNDIDSTKDQIDANNRNSATLEQEKIIIADRYQKDIIRYKELESLRKTLKRNQENEREIIEPVIYECPSTTACQKAWQLAQIYAKDNASGQIEIITNTLILTSKPEKNTDVALSFSRIPNRDKGNQIVLEVSCAQSDQGVELCRSDMVKKIRSNFIILVQEKS